MMCDGAYVCIWEGNSRGRSAALTSGTNGNFDNASHKDMCIPGTSRIEMLRPVSCGL
jgi:hypothetical protein